MTEEEDARPPAGGATDSARAPSPVADAAASLRTRLRGVRLGLRRPVEDEDEGPFFPPEAPAEGATVWPERAVWPARPADEAGAGADHPRPRPRPAAAAGTPTPEPDPVPPPTPVGAPAVAADGSAARPRPRPRPAAAPSVRAAATETSADPGSTPVAPRPVVAATTAPDTDTSGTASAEAGHRSPDITRYLTVTEPVPEAVGSEKPRRRRRSIRGSRGLRALTRLTIIGVIVAVAALVLRAYVVTPYYIPSASMEPTLRGGSGTNDRILVDKITYRIHDPHQGDIVVFDRPATWKVDDATLVKRIVGLPGDIVSLRRGVVFVNGVRLTEDYLNPACGAAPSTPHTRTSQWTVPMNDYFVMGDNRCNSEDSRDFGPIPRSAIVGRAFLIFWPVTRIGTP